MSDTSAALILDTALSLAEARGWERLQLYEVADALGIGMDAIARHYPDKDALVDAWFARAEQAMLARARDEDLAALLPAERLEELLVAWLRALSRIMRWQARCCSTSWSRGICPCNWVACTA